MSSTVANPVLRLHRPDRFLEISESLTCLVDPIHKRTRHFYNMGLRPRHVQDLRSAVVLELHRRLKFRLHIVSLRVPKLMPVLKA